MKYFSFALMLAFAACAQAPGQEERITVYATNGARVTIHASGTGQGGTATATPDFQLSVPVTP